FPLNSLDFQEEICLGHGNTSLANRTRRAQTFYGVNAQVRPTVGKKRIPCPAASARPLPRCCCGLGNEVERTAPRNYLYNPLRIDNFRRKTVKENRQMLDSASPEQHSLHVDVQRELSFQVCLGEKMRSGPFQVSTPKGRGRCSSSLCPKARKSRHEGAEVFF